MASKTSTTLKKRRLIQAAIWLGTFLISFVFSTVMTAVVYPMYSLFIVVGLVVATLAACSYQAQSERRSEVRTDAACSSDCGMRLLSCAADYTCKPRDGPPPTFTKGVAHSDPWLCTSTKISVVRSFSSPRLEGSVPDDTWPPTSPIGHKTQRLPMGYLPRAPPAAGQDPCVSNISEESPCKELGRDPSCGGYEPKTLWSRRDEADEDSTAGPRDAEASLLQSAPTGGSNVDASASMEPTKRWGFLRKIITLKGKAWKKRELTDDCESARSVTVLLESDKEQDAAPAELENSSKGEHAPGAHIPSAADPDGAVSSPPASSNDTANRDAKADAGEH